MQAITKNIQWEFTGRKVTAWGGMRMFKEFLDRTEIRKVIEESCLPRPASNCGYNPVQIVESFWVSVRPGGVRFSHTAMVRFDDALKEIFGWNRIPCVSTYTGFFKKFNREYVDNVFGKINKWFFEQIPEKTITLDLDSSTEYIIAVKMNPVIKGKIQAIKNWTRIDNGIECGEFEYQAAFRCVMAAYNLVSLFRQAVLGLKIQPRLQTIRFQRFAIGSWIGKKYRQKVLKVSLAQKRRPWFEGLFAKIDGFSRATAFKT